MEPFKKHFRAPDENLKIRNSASFSPEELAEIKKDLISHVTEIYNATRERSLDPNNELGENIEKRIEMVFAEAVTYFQSLGIENVMFNEFFLLNDSFDQHAGEASRFKGVVVNNPKLEEPEINQLCFLKVLAHELYHSTASTSITVQDTIVDDRYLHRHIHKDEGASFDKNEEPMLLEEGLAAHFEEYMTEKIRGDFSSETNKAYEEVTGFALQYYDKPEEIDKYDIQLHGTEEGTHFTSSSYYPAKKIVRYLEQEIEGFHSLAEQARINRHTLPLARAIEARFGKGEYRLLTTATVLEAPEVLRLLHKNSSDVVP